MISLAIAGASGRMGQALQRLLPEFPGVQLSGALVSPGNPLAGTPPFGTDLPEVVSGAQAVIDFSRPEVTAALVRECLKKELPILIGTTGLGAELQEAIDAAARRIPVLQAANTSVGVAVLQSLVRQAAAALPAGFDIEIVESHHRHKVDAPSGTALALAQSAGAGRSAQFGGAGAVLATGRREGQRGVREIGFAVLRGGDVIGEHEVRFLGAGEQLSLGHRVTDRAIFARGALEAVQWLVCQPAGSYRMGDFLGLN